MVDTPNKAVRSEVLSYIEKMNQAQIKHHKKNNRLLDSVNYFDLELGYVKEGENSQKILVKVNPHDAIKNGYIKINAEGFSSKYYQYLSYSNGETTAVNLAIPKTFYHFGNKNPFFWYEIQPLQIYIGLVNFEDDIITENVLCSLKYPEKNIEFLIKNNLNNLSIMGEKIKRISYCHNYDSNKDVP